MVKRKNSLTAEYLYRNLTGKRFCSQTKRCMWEWPLCSSKLWIKFERRIHCSPDKVDWLNERGFKAGIWKNKENSAEEKFENGFYWFITNKSGRIWYVEELVVIFPVVGRLTIPNHIFTHTNSKTLRQSTRWTETAITNIDFTLIFIITPSFDLNLTEFHEKML